jgi:hypothetical protein
MDKINKAKSIRDWESERRKKINLHLNGCSAGFGYEEKEIQRAAPASMQPFMPDFFAIVNMRPDSHLTRCFNMLVISVSSRVAGLCLALNDSFYMLHLKWIVSLKSLNKLNIFLTENEIHSFKL